MPYVRSELVQGTNITVKILRHYIMINDKCLILFVISTLLLHTIKVHWQFTYIMLGIVGDFWWVFK